MLVFFLLIAYFLLTFIWLAAFAVIASMAYGLITTRVPFVPVPRYVVEAVKTAMPLREGDVAYDLGSGDGRIVYGLAKAYPGARVIGVEKAPLPYLLSLIRSAFARRSNAKTLMKDFSKVSLTDATHVYMYLFPEVVEMLKPKFEREFKPGVTVVSCDFPFKTKEPVDKKVIQGKASKYTLYTYKF